MTVFFCYPYSKNCYDFPKSTPSCKEHFVVNKAKLIVSLFIIALISGLLILTGYGT